MTAPYSIDWGHLADLATAGRALGSALNNNGVSGGSDGFHDTSWSNASTLPGYDAGRFDNGLYGPLSYHPQDFTGGEKFTWSIQDTGAHTRTLTQMTLAGALSWLRDQAVHSSQTYDEVVLGLVQSGYLTPAEARYGGYSSAVGSAFLRSAVDVEGINNDGGVSSASGGGGIVTTWWDHINALIEGRKASGQIDPNTGLPPSGSGGSAGPPTRTDRYTNPDDVKYAINNAAMSVLGRHLNDGEIQQFQSLFHGQEQNYNTQVYGQQMANYNNQTSSPDATAPPSLTAASTNYAENSPALADDRTRQLVGSYIGVLRNITGLGSGGIASAVR